LLNTHVSFKKKNKITHFSATTNNKIHI
jgi:hypothetical protein